METTFISTFSITLNLCAAIAIILMLSGVWLGGNRDQPLTRVFFALLLINLTANGCELLDYALQGNDSAAAVFFTRLAVYFSYALGSIQFAAYIGYLYLYLRTKGEVSKKPFYLLWLLAAAMFLVDNAAVFREVYSYFDESNYFYRQTGYWINQVFPVLITLGCTAVTLFYRWGLRRRELVSLLLYTLISIAFNVTEAAVEGLYICYVGTALVAFIIYINIQVGLDVQVRETNAEIAEKRVALMLSQIQPHFLYNSLSTIAALCDIDARLAKESILDFGHYLRGNLESIGQKNTISFHDELEHVKTYLALEKRRFEERLEIVYDIRSTDFHLPPLSLQPLVENAVRHGVAKSQAGGRVTIRAWDTPDDWLVAVHDNGEGFDVEQPKGDGRSHIGIENVRQRLKALCRGSLSVESILGEGTTATMVIPKGGRAE